MKYLSKPWYPSIFSHNPFGLYNFEDIDLDKSKYEILKGFSDIYLEDLKTRLNEIGLEFLDIRYYSPRTYNYENDDIEIQIKIKSIQKLKKAIKAKEDIINKLLGENLSCDGYISLTQPSVKEEYEAMKSDRYMIDNIVLKTIVDFDISEFDIYEHLIYIILDDEEYEDDIDTEINYVNLGNLS